jgi:hypothetical protein
MKRFLLTLVSSAFFALPSALLAAEQQPIAQTPTREFPAENCRFTLPGKDWFWTSSPPQGMLCAAQNARGFTFLLGAFRPPNAGPSQPEFKSAEEYERGFYEGAAGEFTKRGGHFLTFNGVSCYQAESLMKDGRTSAHRAFVADGAVFNLMVIGSKEPVEHDPDFEKLMSGFAFLKPPVQAGANGAGIDKSDVSYRMGQIAGCAIIGAIVVGVVVLLARKKSRPVRRNIDDDRAFAEALDPVSPRNRRQVEFTSPPDAAVAKYRKGMKDLGRGLIALAFLQLFAGAIAFAAVRESVIPVVIVAFGVLHAVLGVLALRLHGWVNYAVAMWATLLLFLNLIALGTQTQQANPLGWIAFLIPGALLYYSIKNLSAWGNAKAAKLDSAWE